MGVRSVGLLTLAALLAAACAEPEQRPRAPTPPRKPPTASVDGGEVRGTAEDGLFVFKGIPFAAPPVGARRWRAPQPVQPWEGVRAATAFGPNPAQPAAPGSDAPGYSEDCLYLNVWRPASSVDEPLPVMVWIYGGGLVRGGASDYPGEFLARQGLVVVTFNYRLGRLGFFAHPALARESPAEVRGNYGYMDQIAALQWVQRNIAAFGGDPERVTIAGESAGGGSVLVLLTSPLARGLFRGAILESAGIPSARAGASPMRPLAAAETIALEYARGLGIEGDDEAALEALRALPTATLVGDLEGTVLSILGGPEVPGLAHSIIDGRLVAETPEAALRGGRQARVPVITGANDADLAMSPARHKEPLLALFGPLEPQARQLYDPRGQRTLAQLVDAVVSDEVMVEPSRHLAEEMTRAGQPAWYYRFSYVAELQRAEVPGALHATEIMYAFDAVSALMPGKATRSDVDMGRTLSGYWVDFVKSGDPNGGGRPEWPPYDPAAREVLDLGSYGVRHGPDPLRERLDLWRAVWERAR
jgi:para-nitrobenzyl esterase